MKNLSLFLSFSMVLLMMACGTEENHITPTVESSDLVQTRNGAIQVSGVGSFDDGNCDVEEEEALFALYITGDLEGCVYTYVDEFDCYPSGTYRESGREYFVGTYDGEFGTFWMSYNYIGKFEDCEDGILVGTIFGRCQHFITNDSGTGIFEGVDGLFRFESDISSGTFEYNGHLAY